MKKGLGSSAKKYQLKSLGNFANWPILSISKDQVFTNNFLENVLSVILQIFVNLEVFECNTTSDWLNRTV